jgi:1,2-dihydroxy-3-keto-5-methylthiopentene dioxygenase
MNILLVYKSGGVRRPTFATSNDNLIRERLARIGVEIEKITPTKPLSKGASEEEILKQYDSVIAKERERALAAFGEDYSIDVRGYDNVPVSMRGAFKDKHTHHKPEVRIIVEGKGIFYFEWINENKEKETLVLKCGPDTLLRIPRGIEHSFDMGAKADFRAIRFFGEKGYHAIYVENEKDRKSFYDYPEYIAA